MAQAIAARLSLTLSDLADHRAQLAAHLKDKEMLLVLDNMEHLLADAALLSDLLAAAPGLKLLVTSRQRLELPEEWVFDLHGFPLPDGASPLADNGGVALFVQAAQRVNHQFVLTEEDETAVTRICQLVGGMPLGLQLAATWVRVLSCAEIAQEIERDLDFLSTSQRHLPERQRSLRAVFDYSWQLLSDAEQAVCSRLALFRGGFSREAAQAVAGAVLPVLSSLVDRALVNRLGDGRYDMHELVRQYAAEHLQAQPEALLGCPGETRRLLFATGDSIV
jgi:predicted ATPase